MTGWLLILYVWSAGSGTMSITQAGPFTSEASCQAARGQINDSLGSFTQMRSLCVRQTS